MGLQIEGVVDGGVGGKEPSRSRATHCLFHHFQWRGFGLAGLRLDSRAMALQGKENPYESIMITSKITSKAQTTIPQPVRAALHLQEGDEVVYKIEGDHAVIAKVRAAENRSVDDPFATFNEWSSDADRRGYVDF